MAARGQKIIISSQPQGKFMDVIVNGALKPGTVVEIQTGFYRGNRHRVRAYQPGTDGERRLIMVLLEKENSGGNITDAYADGEWAKAYCPIPGEELNMLVKDVSGTGTFDEFADGELAIVDTGTGKLIRTTGSPESEPFVSLDALADVSEDTLHPFMFTGY